MTTNRVRIAPTSARNVAFTLSFAASLLIGSPSGAQTLSPRADSSTPPAPASAAAHATRVTASQATQPPTIDGSDSDPAWANAIPITGFRMFQPVEDGEPHLRTEAKVTYDAANFYVFVRAYDPHPDSIIGLLSSVT